MCEHLCLLFSVTGAAVDIVARKGSRNLEEETSSLDVPPLKISEGKKAPPWSSSSVSGMMKAGDGGVG